MQNNWKQRALAEKAEQTGWSTSDLLKSPYAVRFPAAATSETSDILSLIKERIAAEGAASFVTGINATTRAVERDELSVVIVCRQVDPLDLVSHLPVICFQQRVSLSFLAAVHFTEQPSLIESVSYVLFRFRWWYWPEMDTI